MPTLTQNDTLKTQHLEPRTPISLADLALLIGGTLIGDPSAASRIVSSCSPLQSATASNVSLLHNVRYARQLDTTLAGCVILAPTVQRASPAPKDSPPSPPSKSKTPTTPGSKPSSNSTANANTPPSASALKPPSTPPPSSAPTSTFTPSSSSARMPPSATTPPSTPTSSSCTIPNRQRLRPLPRVTLYDDCVVGNRCILHAGAVVGSDGYGFATHNGVHHKIPQTGNVIIDDDVEIGGNTVIERAVLESTTIGKGTKIGNCVIIGHNCTIGPGNLLVSQVGIAGSTTTGKYVVMAGQVGVAGHLHIPDMVRVAAQSGIMIDPEKPGIEIGGSPAMEASHARRVYLQFVQLPELAKRVKELEKQLAKIQPPTL